tara:strand:- start:268 stop:1161 length:894 start_codon:yes stop_codon:yes gene_type:complete
MVRHLYPKTIETDEANLARSDIEKKEDIHYAIDIDISDAGLELLKINSRYVWKIAGAEVEDTAPADIEAALIVAFDNATATGRYVTQSQFADYAGLTFAVDANDVSTDGDTNDPRFIADMLKEYTDEEAAEEGGDEVEIDLHTDNSTLSTKTKDTVIDGVERIGQYALTAGLPDGVAGSIGGIFDKATLRLATTTESGEAVSKQSLSLYEKLAEEWSKIDSLEGKDLAHLNSMVTTEGKIYSQNDKVAVVFTTVTNIFNADLPRVVDDDETRTALNFNRPVAAELQGTVKFLVNFTF